LKRDFLVFGDSHSLSAWNEEAALCRNDGQTLNGAINTGFDQWIERFDGIKTLRTYFGNIDIRHHVCRLYSGEETQLVAIKELVKRYFHELERVKLKYGLEQIEIVAALPIENTSRKLPKTGYYKGQPYWGTWDERMMISLEFNRICRSICDRLTGYTFVEWPNEFVNSRGELDFAFMERPQSVHISPEHYMWRI